MADESIEEKLRKEFSNYERTVWIVNCLEGHFRKYYNDLLVCFDRYPEIPHDDENPLTPDFSAVFAGPYEIVGEVKRALGNLPEAIEANFQQLKRYDRSLLLRATPNNPPTHQTEKHDLLVLINLAFANKEAKKLGDLVQADRKLGAFQRGVVVFAAACDTQQAKVNWIFSWVNCSDRLNDGILPEGRRLSDRHHDNGEAIVVFPDVYAGLQAIHHFCNDVPPDVYLAVVLWHRIFPKLIPQEDREVWVAEKDCQGIIEFDVAIKALLAFSKNCLNYSLRKVVLESVLALLVKAGLVEKKPNDVYRILYRKFRPQQMGDKLDESAQELKLDHVKEGIIDALVRGQRPVKTRGGRRVRSRRSKDDKRQLPLF